MSRLKSDAPLPCLGHVHAGPLAQDHALDQLDLMGRPVHHPKAMFLLDIKHDSMRKAGIPGGA